MENNDVEVVDFTGIQVKEDSEVTKQGATLAETALAYQVKDDLTCHQAVAIGKTMKLFLDGPGKYHDEEIDAANRLHKMLCSKRNAICDPVKSAYKIIKDRIALWDDEQNRKREEAIRKAEEEAAAKEREKQAKIQAKIDEENRKVAEAKEKERKIQAAKDALIEKEKNKKKAEEMQRQEEARKKEQARIDEENRLKAEEKQRYLQEKKENVYVAPKPVAFRATPNGVSTRFSYEPTVLNKALVPDCYKTVDLAALKRAQGAAKGGLNVPGVRFTKRPIGALRKAS